MKNAPIIPLNGVPDARGGHPWTEKQARELERVSRDAPSCLKKFQRAFKGKSLRAGVDALCIQCTSCDRLYIKDCPSSNCALWAYRPFQQMKGRSRKAVVS